MPEPPAHVREEPRAEGNAGAAQRIARAQLNQEFGAERQAQPLKLRTALDSALAVSKKDDVTYSVALTLEAGKPPIVVAEYSLLAPDPDLRHLPIYLEDFAAATAQVRIRYDAKRVQLKILPSGNYRGHALRVDATPADPEALALQPAPAPRAVPGGVVVNGKESAAQHSSGTDTDRIISSLAAVEGGFASVEASDAGVLTWGQGQWTAASGHLQEVLGFIQDRRADLYDKYWGAVGLKIDGNQFAYRGTVYPTNSKQMKALFHPNAEYNKAWATRFAQAAMDPQIQRLQREYQRSEVNQVLDSHVGGQAPEAWLDTEGKAFYYSMFVNLPSAAKSNFKDALAGAGAVGKSPTPALIERVSRELEQRFSQSSVTASAGGHMVAFWGERGRAKAIAAETDPKRRAKLETRESRYQRTKAAIKQALAQENVEPDVPPQVEPSS